MAPISRTVTGRLPIGNLQRFIRCDALVGSIEKPDWFADESVSSMMVRATFRVRVGVAVGVLGRCDRCSDSPEQVELLALVGRPPHGRVR